MQRLLLQSPPAGSSSRVFPQAPPPGFSPKLLFQAPPPSSPPGSSSRLFPRLFLQAPNPGSSSRLLFQAPHPGSSSSLFLQAPRPSSLSSPLLSFPLNFSLLLFSFLLVAADDAVLIRKQNIEFSYCFGSRIGVIVCSWSIQVLLGLEYSGFGRFGKIKVWSFFRCCSSSDRFGGTQVWVVFAVHLQIEILFGVVIFCDVCVFLLLRNRVFFPEHTSGLKSRTRSSQVLVVFGVLRFWSLWSTQVWSFFGLIRFWSFLEYSDCRRFGSAWLWSSF